MARKSKGFNELLNQQRQGVRPQESDNRLAQRVKQNLKGKVIDVIANPKGEVKMSEVLEAFVEPYLDVASNLEQRQKMFALAVVAWNIALLPEEEQQKEMEMMINQIFGGHDRQMQRDIRDILKELVERKQKFFADNQRYILDFELTGRRNDLRLSVVSSPSPQD